MEDMYMKNLKESVDDIVNMANNMKDAENGGTPEELLNMMNKMMGKADELTLATYDDVIKNEEQFKILLEQQSAQTGKENKLENLSKRLTFYEGKTIGKCALRVLDLIIENNTTEEIKIMVKFMGQETSVVDGINNMKKNIEDILDDYEITYEYDENKCINKAVIEKVTQ